MQLHRHAARIGDVGDEAGKNVGVAQYMADQRPRLRVLQNSEELLALVDQHPKALVDAAAGLGEGVGARPPVPVAEAAPVLVRGAVEIGGARLLLGQRLLIQPAAHRRQALGVQGVGQQAIAEPVQVRFRPIEIPGGLRQLLRVQSVHAGSFPFPLGRTPIPPIVAHRAHIAKSGDSPRAGARRTIHEYTRPECGL